MSERALRILSYNVRYFGHALRGLATTRASMEGSPPGWRPSAPWPI
jgi:hypothetical protein